MAENSMETGDDKTRSHIAMAKGTAVGRYRIIEKIGAGGMGEVYLAEDTELDRKVALKFLPASLCQDEDCRTRFIREAQAAAKLDHPNIVTVHEVSEYQGRPYFVMQHIEGQSLRDVIKDQEFNLDQIIDLAIQVCEGLREAHEAGIIHRDVKPSNIILNNRGRPKLFDFGLAVVRGTTKLTKTGSTLGTIGYMSPEQIQGKEVDLRSDLFSFGVVLYELIAGRKPFEGDNESTVNQAIVGGTPEPLARYKSNVPDELQRIVLKLLAKDPDLRYQSAAGILSDLKGLAISGPGAFVDRGASLKRRRRWLGLSASAIAILILLALVFKPWKFAIQSTQEFAAKPRRLAVLQLKNLGPPDDEYLCYGITEDLIVDLTRNGTIGIAPMRSIIKYRDSEQDLTDIADELGVSLIVDGSVTKTDNGIRIAAQLMDVTSGEHLWAERWTETTENLPQIKESLAKGIAQALEIDSARIQVAEIGHPDAENPVAYDYYLRGKYAFLNKTDASDVEVALGLFQKALELEPSLLAARIGIARILDHRGEHDEAIEGLASVLSESRQRKMRSEEAEALRLLADNYGALVLWDTAHNYASQALHISQNQGDLYGELRALLLSIHFFSRQRRMGEAIKLFDRVVEINQLLDDQSALCSTLRSMGLVYDDMGKQDSAKVLYDRAMTIAIKRNDLDMIGDLHALYGTLYVSLGDNTAALEHYNKALEIHRKLDNPIGIATILENLGRVQLQAGNYRKNRELLEEAAAIYLELGNHGKYTQCRIGIAAELMNTGEYDQAIAIYQDLQELTEKRNDLYWQGVIHQNMGFAYFYNGEPTAARENFYASLQAKEQLEVMPDVAFAAASLGEFYYIQDNPDSSRKYMEKSLAITESISNPVARIWSSAYQGALRVREGHFDDGISQLRETIQAADSIGYGELIIISSRLLGQALAENGRTDKEQNEGQMVLEDALALAKEKNIVHEIRWISKLLNIPPES